MDEQELVAVELCECCGIVIGGELDVMTAPLLLEVAPAVATADPRPINVNLANVTFMDASGLRGLLCLKHSLPNVRVVAVSPPVEKVLLMTGTYDDLIESDLSNTA